MSNIGIKGLINKNVDEIENIVRLFIKSSISIRNKIIKDKNPDICIQSLIRDTYMCNLILRYVGLMTIVNTDPKWDKIDDILMKYIHEYYTSDRFKNKLVELYEYFLGIYEKTKTNYDYCKFLDKMISRGEITKRGTILKNFSKRFENEIFNIINVNPIVKINKRHFKIIPSQFEVDNDKVIVHLTQNNYYELLDIIDDHSVLCQLENQYMSRTKNILSTFSKLIVTRQLLAEELNYETFFKYINRGKSDNSDTIKDFLNELNDKLDSKIKTDISKIYQSFVINNRTYPPIIVRDKMSCCDIIKYVRSKKNTTHFKITRVMKVLFYVLKRYFNIVVEETDEIGWNKNVIVYKMHNNNDNRFLGRFYMDIIFDENKKVINPISIRLADKMQIDSDNRSTTEIALIANYNTSKGITHNEIILLFKEFGYIISNMCYDSRVGLINYDEEFANYIPSLMECFACDRDIIYWLLDDMDSSIIDHIELSRDIDMCYNIKLKCITATFDHLIHNSKPLLKIIMDNLDTKGDANNELLETYRNIFIDVMKSVSNMLDTNIDNIDPIVIIQEINSSQGVLYSNLMNEIFAYTTYWIIKNNSIKNRDIVAEFRKIILDNGVDNYRELIRNFLKYSDVNCFSLYVTNVIKIDPVDEYITEDSNYFEADIDVDGPSDKEDIIQFNRI